MNERLRETKAAYAIELERVKVMEMRVMRLKEEEAYYKEKKPEVAQKLVEVGQAGRELVKRSNRLQEEREQFEKEQAALAIAKEKVEQVDQGIQTVISPWSNRSYTAMTLSERFTQYKFSHSRMVMADNGTMKLTIKSAIDDLLV